MPFADWIITLSGALLGAAALALLVWSLLADGLRTRPARRAGTLRRCPRCWYDMSAVESLTCPECGRAARRERSLARARLRWRAAALSLPLLALGAGVIAYPHSTGGRWQRWLPDTAVLLVLRYGADPGWAVEEIGRRAWGDPMLPRVEHPHRFSPRQLDLLTDGCLRLICSTPPHASAYTAWGLLTRLSPEPERAAEVAIAQLTSTSAQERYAAARFLLWTSDQLPVKSLQAARARLESFAAGADSAALTAQERGTSLETAADLAAAIAARADTAHQARLATSRETELTPESIAADLQACTPDELRLLHRRLGLARHAPLGRPTDKVHSIELQEILLDDDATPDCMLEINHRGRLSSDRLYFVRRGSSWRFAGRIELANTDAAVEQEFVSCAEGHRFLRLAGRPPYISSGYTHVVDTWYRVRGSRLHLAQLVTTARSDVSTIDRLVASEPPRVVHADGRDLVVYPMALRVQFEVHDESGTGRSVLLAQQLGEFRFPLDADESALNRPLGGGPWGGEQVDWFTEVREEELLPTFLPRLLEIARSDDDAAKEQLATILSMMEDSEEVIAIRAALDEP